MGNRQALHNKPKYEQFFDKFSIIQENQNEGIRFLEHKETQKEYLLRQLTYNDKKQYQKAIQTVRTKKEQLSNSDHLCPITQIFESEQDQLCSTFYKLFVLFQFPQRTLDDQINERNLRKNSFAQTQLWSILASCILGLSHLQKKGIKHGCLKSSTILLSQQGHIKLADPYSTGSRSNYQILLNKRSVQHIYLSPQQCEALQNQVICPVNINLYKSDIFTLGMILLECGLLQYQDECYRDQYTRLHYETLQYNKNRFRKVYSEDLSNMLEYMLGVEVNTRPEWIQLENYVITDNMGQSFISQGRKSLIAGYSKPVSVNVNNLKKNHFEQGSQFGTQQKLKNQQKITSQSQISNKGIGISSSKPFSVQKFETRGNFENQTKLSKNQSWKNQQDKQWPNKTNQNQQQGTSQKPKSIVNLPIHTANNFPEQKNTTTFIPLQQPNSNFCHEIQPLRPSNISNTRPFRSIFPNPFYQTRTKPDENLVEVEEKTVSQSSYSTNRNQFSPRHKGGASYQENFPTGSYVQESIQANQKNSPNEFQTGFGFNKKPFSQESRANSGSEFVIQTFKLGSRYEGYKLNGMRHGQGKFYYQDGGMYDGEWVKNKMQGYGKLYYQSGKIAYDGNWVQDQFTGKGILYNQNPDPLEGEFDCRDFDEVNEFWTRYEGEFSDDSKNGPGRLYLSNGECFEGQFQNDMAQGHGVFYRRNGRKVVGFWQNNVMIQDL